MDVPTGHKKIEVFGNNRMSARNNDTTSVDDEVQQSKDLCG